MGLGRDWTPWAPASGRGPRSRGGMHGYPPIGPATPTYPTGMNRKLGGSRARARCRRRDTSGGPAFTLIELQVVIGIKATLASLLLPAQSGGKYSALDTRCIGNLRQLGFALHTYTTENEGAPLLRGVRTDLEAQWWYDVLDVPLDHVAHPLQTGQEFPGPPRPCESLLPRRARGTGRSAEGVREG